MVWWTARTKGILAAVLLLVSAVPATLLDLGEGAECVPVCDECHYAHDRVYHAYLDITRFDVPASLSGADVKEVEVQLRLHGNVGLGYTTIRHGWLELTSVNDLVSIPKAKQDFISYEPGFRSFFWNISGRLGGIDSLHVEVWALGVHLAVEFSESADKGPITVTNPVNAPPRVSFSQPDGYADVADTAFMVGFNIDDPNSDHVKLDLYYDTDRDRTNGQTLVVAGIVDVDTYNWNTRSLADGWYYLHVDGDDQRGGTGEGTSVYPVIISHNNRVPKVNLVSPSKGAIVHDPVQTFTWYAEDGDGDPLTFEFYIGRDIDHMEMVGETTFTSFDYAADDNARLLWTVIPRDRKVRGWCDGGPWRFTTDIDYPVEVDLILPADNSIVPGPDVKLVWYGRDRDFEQIVFNVFLEHNSVTERIAKAWDDPGGPILIVPDLEPGETYRWWVEGDNPYSPKGVSERWTFRVATKGMPVAILHEEDVGPATVTLEWSASPFGTAPAMYDVHLVDHLQGDRLVLDNTTLTTLVLDDLIEDTVYHWYVLPVDADGNEGYSEPVFRSFTFDHNTPPVANITQPIVQVPPGEHELRWTGFDANEDQIYYDLYIDPLNATTLIATDLTATRYTVDLEPDKMYRWRVVPRDLLGVGTGAMGVVVTEAAGSTVSASGHLEAPADGAAVHGPVVNLTWVAEDPLDRVLLFDVFISMDGSNPLAENATTVNTSITWWTVELEPEVTEVAWGVLVRPLRGPTTILGTASFTIVEPSDEPPVTRFSVEAPGSNGSMTFNALEEVTFNASGSASPTGRSLSYWFDFGDGSSSGWLSEATTAHMYLLAGTYNATLVVRDDMNRTSEPEVVVIEVTPGELESDEAVPGPGPLWSLLAILASALLVDRNRRHPRVNANARRDR